MALNSDLREFLKLLNTNEVEYVIVGAYAVGFYGFMRHTGDLDVWVRPTRENATRVMKALSAFGFGDVGLRCDDFEKPDYTIQLGYPPFRIDLLTGITGVTADKLWASRVGGDLEGIPVQFIGHEELLRNKESTGRSKDLIDAGEVRKRVNFKDGAAGQ
jgi:hypothetical protein